MADAVDALHRLLRSHAIAITAEPAAPPSRFWKALGQHNNRAVFLKAAFEPGLRETLRRETAVATEVLAAGIPATIPVFSFETDDIVLAAFEFEETAMWQMGSEQRARSLDRTHAAAVAEALARLALLAPEEVPSAPRRPPHDAPSDAFRRLARRALKASPQIEGRRESLSALLDTDRSVLREMDALADSIERLTASPSPIFLHGDASPANTSFRGNGVAALFDWEWSRFEGDTMPWIGIDVMNYVTRSWANVEFVRALVDGFIRSIGVTDGLLVSLRASLVLQCLNKLGPSYLYPEPKWQATQERFDVLRRFLRIALADENLAALTGGG